MNLREAIEAGAQRVDARCKFSFVKDAVTSDGGHEFHACALGAAYLGCHPDVRVASLLWKAGPVRDWVNNVLTLEQQLEVFSLNDNETSGRNWGDVLDGLGKLGDIEVCK